MINQKGTVRYVSGIFQIRPYRDKSLRFDAHLLFSTGVIYVYRVSRKRKIPFDPLLTLAYIMIFGGVLGARLFYVLFHLDEFKNDWLASINPFHSGQFGIAGLNLYGGFSLRLFSFYLYSEKRLPLLSTLDLFAPTVGLGLIFTRVGCFLNGCCFGTPTDLPWGVEFPNDSIPFYIFGTEHLHPAQLYSSLYGLLLFLVLHWRLKHKSFDGQVVSLLFMVEAIFRYLIEYVRYYETEMTFLSWG